MFPNQEPGRRETPLKNHPQNWSILRVVLQGGSSSFRFLIREHSKQETPPGGLVSFNQSTLTALCGLGMALRVSWCREGNWVMSWGVSSDGIQVSFAEYSLFSRAVVQKRPTIPSVWWIPSEFHQTTPSTPLSRTRCVCACVCVCVCVYVERDIKKREVLGLLSDPITCCGLGIRACLISLLPEDSV